MLFSRKPLDLPSPETALKGRSQPVPTAKTHFVNGRDLLAEVPAGFERAIFGLGCFWGAERKFWQQDGVWLTRVGYAGGYTPNPTYEEVCSGHTGHTEVVDVIFDPKSTSFATLMKVFLENHDPTQGMRQGNDIGTQYRSAVFTTDDEQAKIANQMIATYEASLAKAGHKAKITTEVAPLDTIYLAEDYHQQYLAKNPTGYCGLGGTGVSCPVGLEV